MPNKITFNDIVQNKVKDFVNTKRWSNSQFASKYSATYAEIYGKMGAPSTSTSRKLVEEKGHEYSEKECIVLEKLTYVSFHRMWIDEQERIILSKKDKYALEHGEEIKTVANKLDSEIQVTDKLRRLVKEADTLSVDDVTESISRYVSITTSKPMVILCDSSAFASYLVEESVEYAFNVSADALTTDGADIPNNIIYTTLCTSPMSKEAGRSVNEALKVIRDSQLLGKAKHVIIIIETWDDESIALAQKEWTDKALMLQFRWSYKMMCGWLRIEKENGRIHPSLHKFIDKELTEVKRINLPKGNISYRPCFEVLYEIHSLTCMHLDYDEKQLLMLLMANDCYYYGMTDWLISMVYKTDKNEETKAIRNELRHNLLSRKPELPEAIRKDIMKCLNRVGSWSETFKEEIMSWIDQGGSMQMPDCDGAEGWMDLLMDQYEKQQEWLTDEAYLAALDTLKRNGFPVRWFNDDCDQKSMLTAILTFPEWKKEHKLDDHYTLPQLSYVLLSGEAPSLDAEGWKRWFERCHTRNLVGTQFDLSIKTLNLKRQIHLWKMN